MTFEEALVAVRSEFGNPLGTSDDPGLFLWDPDVDTMLRGYVLKYAPFDDGDEGDGLVVVIEDDKGLLGIAQIPTEMPITLIPSGEGTFRMLVTYETGGIDKPSASS